MLDKINFIISIFESTIQNMKPIVIYVSLLVFVMSACVAALFLTFFMIDKTINLKFKYKNNKKLNYNIFTKMNNIFTRKNKLEKPFDKFDAQRIENINFNIRGGIYNIEKLYYVNGFILVVDWNDRPGEITYRRQRGIWTQSHDGHRNRFPSPVARNVRDVEVVESVIGATTNVLGIVVFSDRSRFPDKAPQGVFKLSEVRRWLSKQSCVDVDTTRTQWETLLRIAQTGKPIRISRIEKVA